MGRRAAQRALRRLNPRKPPTQKAPVIFEPRTARALLGELFDAVNGGAIYRHSSFLTGKLGEKVASELLTVVDDGTMPGLFGSSPFDDEGVRLAPHHGDRTGRAEELSSEHLFGAAS